METVAAKTILQTNRQKGWFSCEYNMNIYRGCSHGCLYCDNRSNCYHLENFDIIRTKQNALRILRDELARKAKSGVVCTGAMSDPYNPQEETHLLTRHALELLDAYEFGVAIATKSCLVQRDADLLTSIAAHSPVLVKITITTPNDALAVAVEPRAPSSTQRFAALKSLSDTGIFCGVLLMPVLPFLQDSPEDILALVRQAAEAGARFIYPCFGVTMRAGQREHLLAGLEAAFPGKDYAGLYRRRFGSRYFCPVPNAKQLWQLFCAECNCFGLLYEMRDINRAFRAGYSSRQLSMF